MAWGIHWQINFQSVTGTDYTLNILQSGYTGSIVALVGAADVFETGEVSDKNVFLPVRGQTGKLNIVTDSTSLVRSIMPDGSLSHRVELLSGGAVKWRGYIQSVAFSQPDDGSMKKATIPVSSVLEAMKAVDFDGNYGKTMTIADAIYDIFGKAGITLGEDANLYMQTEFYDATDFMDTVFCATAFYHEEIIVNDNTPVTLVVADTCHEVLGELLKPFGLSVREYGGNYYIVSNCKLVDTSSLVETWQYDFQTRTLTSRSTNGKVSIASLDQYISRTNQKMSVDEGRRDVRVSLRLGSPSIIDTGNADTPYSTNALYGGDVVDDEGNAVDVMYAQPIAYPSRQRRQLWTEQLYARTQSYSRRRATGQQSWTSIAGTYINVVASSGFNTDTLGHVTDTPDMIGLAATIGSSLIRHGMARRYSELNLSAGLLVNMCSAYRMARYYSPTTIEDSDLAYRLTSNGSYTIRGGYVKVEMDYDVLEYYRRGYCDGNGPNYELYIGGTRLTTPVHHVTSPLSGVIELRIYGGEDYQGTTDPATAFGTPRSIVLHDLRVYWSAKQDDAIARQDSENNYIKLLDRRFSKTETISPVLGTDNNNLPSVSLLLDSDWNEITTYRFLNQSPLNVLRPEMYLLGLMEHQYGQRQLSMTRQYRKAWTARPSVPFTDGSDTYMAVVEKEKWADEERVVTFIQTYQGE